MRGTVGLGNVHILRVRVFFKLQANVFQNGLIDILIRQAGIGAQVSAGFGKMRDGMDRAGGKLELA